MKLIHEVIVGCLLVGCSSFAKTSVVATQPIADVSPIANIYELEALFVEQQYGFLPISPPSEEVYFHSLKLVLPVDWKYFPKDFTKQMYAEMDGNGYPLYRVSVYEDPVTRQTVFLNLYGTEVYRLDAETGYDPYAWQTTYFQLDAGEELGEWEKWIYDPAHIAAKFVLIPEVFHEDYLSVQAEEAALASMMVPMLMSLQLPVTNLQMAINHTTNSTVEVEIGWPSTFTNEVEIFATTDLAGHVWQVVCTDIDTSSSTNFLWEDEASTNTPVRFYIASKADVDGDGDGLADGREIYVHGSDPDDMDSDDDGLDDDVEVGASPPTNPSNSDRQAPVITIASPVNNIVVVP